MDETLCMRGEEERERGKKEREERRGEGGNRALWCLLL
jgi:hypothetical protein